MWDKRPNARPELRLKAGAQRTLEAVSSRPMLGWEYPVGYRWGAPCLAHPCAPASAYWTTSVAWKRTVGGMVSPRALAVLRLMTNSNFVGCSMGRSAGLAPCRSLST